MNFADLIIILFLIYMIYSGFKIGFLREVFPTVGFITAVTLSIIYIPLVIKHIGSQSSRAIWTLVLFIATTLVFITIGSQIGYRLKIKILKKHKIEKIDKILGLIIRLTGGVLVVWIFGLVLLKFPDQIVQSQAQQSFIISRINLYLPKTPSFISTIDNVIAPNGFPLVFISNEPVVNTKLSLNSTPALNSAVNNDQKSIVKLEGIGCGGLVEGSGFVAAKNLVITNAHVVAGIKNPFIFDSNGQHYASIIYFDPSLDLAILRTSNLAGSPLKINSSSINNGTIGAVMGYPGGGNLEAKTAAILDQINATGKNIYNQRSATREIYVLQADIIPGNSGGPFIGDDGSVDGLVFARSTVQNNQGYALVMAPIASALSSALNNYSQVSNGQCAE
jgi:S1-C subfamily serine protease